MWYPVGEIQVVEINGFRLFVLLLTLGLELQPVFLRRHALVLFEDPGKVGGVGKAAGVGNFRNRQGGGFEGKNGAVDPDALNVSRQALLGFQVEQMRKVVGGAAQQFGNMMHAEFGVGELLAHEAFGLKNFSNVTVEFAGAGFDDVSKQAEQREEQPFEHRVASRTVHVVGLRGGVGEDEKYIQIWRVEKFDDLDVWFAGAGFVREVETEGVIVEASDKIAKGSVGLRAGDFAVRYSGGYDANFARVEAEILAGKTKFGRALQLQK